MAHVQWNAVLGGFTWPRRLASSSYGAGGIPKGTTPEAWALAGHPIVGTCPVCGTAGVQFRDFTENLRESGACSQCGSSNRQRQMAFALRASLGLPQRGSLVVPRGCALYSAEANGALHAVLRDQPGTIGSEYWGPDYASGASVNGVRHEDLEQLSFADASFDIVLSSDVLEHVADAYRAHREIFRVLRSGGRHIFTVPFKADAAHDDVRALWVDGRIEYLAEKLYHGDPVNPGEGVLVWRIFGAEMLTRLREIGFAAHTLRLHESLHGIIGDNAPVFVARKP